MQGWNPYPFFRLIIPFIAGILASVYSDLPLHNARIFLTASSLVFILPVFIMYFIRKWQTRWLSGVAVYGFLFVAGFSLTVMHTPKYRSNHIFQHDENQGLFLVRVAEPLAEKTNSYKTVVKLKSFYDTNGFAAVSGKVLVYLQKDTSTAKIKYGDELLIRARINPVSPPGNPHQFNYRHFLANSGIYHQTYLKTDDWLYTNRRQTNPVFLFAFEARKRMLKILDDHGIKGDEYAVISAILLGYDDFMDPELREKYAGAGALHVLCVSGLHVGIIFFLLNFFLNGLNRHKRLRYIKVIILLTSIWSYAFITGLSPSVMRASVMFSLFAWREARKEKSNPYNILAASAFILLAIDPYMITKIGFQLSYAAVLAIIALFNPIYSLMPLKNPVLDYFWKLSVVSIAAQIGTFPFAVFYFHQFPVYFLITNIIVIPLVWLILNMGILILFVSIFFPFISIKLSFVLILLLKFLNGSIFHINSLPGSLLSGLVISPLQVALIYVFIILLGRSIFLKNSNQILGVLSITLILMLSFLDQSLQKVKQKEIVVYQVKNYTAIDFIYGNRASFIADSALYADAQNIDFSISGNRTFRGIDHVEGYQIDKIDSCGLSKESAVKFYEPCFYLFGDKRWAIIDNRYLQFAPEFPIRLDVVVMKDTPPLRITDLGSQFRFSTMISAPSNRYREAKSWRAFCDSIGSGFHEVRTQGFYRMDL